MYKVIKSFIDLQDNNHPYKENEVYPRKDYEPSEERIKELSGCDNKLGEPLIAFVAEKAKKTAKKK